MLEKDLGHLQSVWDLTSEWEGAWDNWKSGTFGSLQTDEMSIQAQGMLKRLGKLAREIKACAHTYNNIAWPCSCKMFGNISVGQELVNYWSSEAENWYIQTYHAIDSGS